MSSSPQTLVEKQTLKELVETFFETHSIPKNIEAIANYQSKGQVTAWLSSGESFPGKSKWQHILPFNEELYNHTIKLFPEFGGGNVDVLAVFVYSSPEGANVIIINYYDKNTSKRHEFLGFHNETFNTKLPFMPYTLHLTSEKIMV